MAGRVRGAGAGTALALAAALLTPASAQASDVSVDPFVGTGGARPWFSANTSPAATRPFGMVQLGPDTTLDAGGSPSASPSGYGAEDTLVRGFSATHLSGAGCPAFGDVPFLPLSGAVPADPATATVALAKGSERAAPGWYKASLANGVRVSLAAHVRAGLAVLDFPTGRQARVVVKGAGSLAGNRRTRVRVTSSRTVTVSATSGRFCGSPSTYRVHVRLRFETPFKRHTTWGGATPDATTAAGTDAGAVLTFGKHAGRVRAQVGVSFVSVAGARRNLASADLGWSFGKLRRAAGRAWSRELGRVEVTGGSDRKRLIFHTALYRALSHPTTLSDADGRYPGFDGRVHTVPAGRRQYTAISGWDAYRTQIQLLAVLRPDVASDIVGSLQRAAEQAGWLPRWPLVSSYTGIMNGDSAAPVIAGAYAFGARDFDLDSVLGLLVRQADDTTPTLGQGWFQPRPGLADYLRLGFVPNSTPERGWPQPHGGSTTLEYAVDDFAISRLAKGAGRPRLANRFGRRSGSWLNLLDTGRGYLLPRAGDGSFPGPDYHPASCCDGFQEGNAAQYTWAVPQDMAGLLSRLGAREQVVQRLSTFHEQLNVGAGAAYAWLGNQPTLATPWAYLWLGEPTLAQDVVARARAQLWTTGPGGVPGNDDLGSLSAWYVWASLGLYPVTPGTATLAVSTPAFPDVTIRSSSGAVTRVVRRGDGAHVRALRVDGVLRSATWVPFQPKRRPNRVVILTTNAAGPSWGTGKGDAPPSYPPG